MDADVTVIAVADDPLLRGRTVGALEAQGCGPPPLLQTRWADLGEAIAEVSSAWVAILPDGAQPSPDWASVLDHHLSVPDVGCVGGRVLEFDGVDRLAWQDPLEVLRYPRRAADPIGGLPAPRGRRGADREHRATGTRRLPALDTL
jgi:hypothetical protein